MNICYVLPTLNITGGVNVIIEHTLQLQRHGHNVMFVHMGEGTKLGWREDCSVPIVSLMSPADMALYAHFAPDVLFATGWQTAYEIVRRRLPAKRYCYFVQDRESGFYPPDSLEHDLANYTLTLPFNYLSEARWICRWLEGDFGHQVAYAPNAINPKYMHPAEPYLAKGSRPRILLEGPLCLERKRMKDAFLAVQGLDAEIWCVSSAGELEPWMKPDVFLNAVPYGRMKHIYSACDIVVKLSSQEGFFGPPLEMMACGGVAVTSNVTGHDEYMEDGVNGFVVNVGDYKAANAALRRLLAEPELLQRMRQNGARTATRFSWDRTGDVVERWLYDVVASPTTADKNPLTLPPSLDRGMQVATRTYFHVVRGFVPPKAASEGLYARALPVAKESSSAAATILTVQGWAFSPGSGAMEDDWRLSVAEADASILAFKAISRADVESAIPAVTTRKAGFVATVVVAARPSQEHAITPRDVVVHDSHGRRVAFQSVEQVVALQGYELTIPQDADFAELGFKLLFIVDIAAAQQVAAVYFDENLDVFRPLSLRVVASHDELAVLEADDLGALCRYLVGDRKVTVHLSNTAALRDVRVAAGF